MGDRPGAARMFAPAIGVDEDVANAHLLDTTGAQTVAIEVEQGDTLGRPASVLASARRGPAGITTRVGGSAVVRDGH
ncbi:PhzF family phenazine biosynthesis protein [Streptomyces sp. CB03234]|uniref:PhzF family phenazine biosynthesis protein n=1 Tax=Streptomyces sp. (strain CB03234) TaxID=1703937 RepID=UPI001F518A12|nr:PhzF family phenazine biosynthesis protein [Streptomyces sp. CB03234]